MRAGVADSLWFFLHCLIDNNAGAGRGIGCTRFVSGRSVFCVACGVCVIFLNTHTDTHTRSAEGALQRLLPSRRELCCVVVRAASAKKGPKKLRLKNVARTNCHLCLFFSFLHALAARMWAYVHTAACCVRLCVCV